jgi:hypothetical protein
MKKTTLISLMLVCVIILTGIIGSAVLAQDDEPIEPVEGAVLIIVPELSMMEVGASQETSIRSRTVLDVGETLRTDATGVALITWFYDGTETLLGPGSKLALNALSGDQTTAFTLDMSLEAGHMISGVGYRVQDNPDGRWTITTPKFTFRPIWGQFEVTVGEDGTTRLVVTEGRVEIQTDGEPRVVEENSFVVNGGDPQTLSEDGIVVNLDGVCTATANTNLNVRLGPNEATRRLDGVPAGQQFWVRSGTEGNIWVQVYFQTDPLDEEGHNYGWVFGPALTFDEATCANVVRAELAAVLFGGLGIDKDPLTNPDADLSREEVYMTVTAYYDGRFN